MRKNNDFGSPADTIDERKQQKIIKAAKKYALEKKLYDTPMRFDAVLVNADVLSDETVSIELIKDAFRIN